MKQVAHLRVLKQEGQPERIFPIYEGITTIGRMESNDICLNYLGISSYHAKIGNCFFYIYKEKINKIKYILINNFIKRLYVMNILQKISIQQIIHILVMFLLDHLQKCINYLIKEKYHLEEQNAFMKLFL